MNVIVTCDSLTFSLFHIKQCFILHYFTFSLPIHQGKVTSKGVAKRGRVRRRHAIAIAVPLILLLRTKADSEGLKSEDVFRLAVL